MRLRILRDSLKTGTTVPCSSRNTAPNTSSRKIQIPSGMALISWRTARRRRA